VCRESPLVFQAEVLGVLSVACLRWPSHRVEGLQLLLYHQRVGVPDSDLKVLQRSYNRAPKQKSGNMTYDQVRCFGLE
jgi:hypothetical protein